MGTGYAKTDPTNFVDGETIEATDFTTEYNAIDAAFHLSTGHTHDGTTAEGGPVTKLLGTAITIGDATSGTDIAVTFDGESNDGVLTWMEDEDYFKFSDDALMNSTEKLYFRDTAIYLNSSADGQLDLVADTEIQIAATTIDINGNVDISGTLTVAGALDFGDAALSNVGDVQLDSIAGDGDTNTSITFSGSDVITVANAGTNQITFNDGSILPVTDNDIDLGSSSYEFKDGYFDGTLYADAINFNGTAIASTAAELNIVDGGTSATSTTVADADRVVLNDNGTMVQVAVTDLSAYFDDEITAMPNLVTTAATTVGVLDSGSITSGFGTIDTGSSTITTTGLISGGSLDIDNVLINGTTIGHTDDTDLITLTDGVVTVAGELDATTLDISGNADIDGTLETDAFSIAGTTVSSTAAELNYNDTGAAVGTVVASKTVTVDSNKDVASFRNITLTGELDAGSLDISGDADIDGTLETDNLTVGGSQGSDGQVLTSTGSGVAWEAAGGGAISALNNATANELVTVGTSTGSGVAWEDSSSGMTSFQLEDGDGTEVAISNAKEVKFIGSGITTNWTDTDNGTDGDPYDLTFTVDAAQTGITSLLATDIKIGEDDQTKIDFETADEIHFYAANTEQVYVADNIFGPQSDSDVDLGTTGVRWKDAFVDSITVTGEIDGASLDISGDADIDGTTNLDVIDVDGAANFAADVTFADGADIITASAGTSNFRAGVNAGNSIESGGNYNVAVGDEAGTALTTGDNNVVVGYAAGDAITTGGSNVAVGTSALSAVTDQSENVAVGNSAMAGATSASGNVAVGDNAGGGATNTADNNVWIGNNAGYATTSGASNVLIGYAAGDAITTGGSNVGVGYNALTTNTTSSENVAVGTAALATQNGGSANVGVGHNALTALTTAGENAACGYAAGTAITTGASNSFFGLYAGYAATTSSYHVLIGRGAGSNITTSHSCIMIGYGSQASAATGVSDELVIGKSMTGKGSNTGFISPNNGAVYQGNNSTAWTQTSDRRIKKNIFDNDIGLEKINQIQVRNFEYRTPDEIDELPEHAAIDKKGLQIGVVAQEIQTVLPDIVEEESTGCLSVNPDNMTWYLVNAVKELSAQVDELKAEIHALKGE